MLWESWWISQCSEPQEPPKRNWWLQRGDSRRPGRNSHNFHRFLTRKKLFSAVGGENMEQQIINNDKHKTKFFFTKQSKLCKTRNQIKPTHRSVERFPVHVRSEMKSLIARPNPTAANCTQCHRHRNRFLEQSEIEILFKPSDNKFQPMFPTSRLSPQPIRLSRQRWQKKIQKKDETELHHMPRYNCNNCVNYRESLFVPFHVDRQE